MAFSPGVMEGVCPFVVRLLQQEELSNIISRSVFTKRKSPVFSRNSRSLLIVCSLCTHDVFIMVGESSDGRKSQDNHHIVRRSRMLLLARQGSPHFHSQESGAPAYSSWESLSLQNEFSKKDGDPFHFSFLMHVLAYETHCFTT